MLTEKDYCDYEICVALYELGYDCHVIHLIAEKITLYEAQKWLREEKLIEVNASFDKMEDGWIAFIQRLDYPDLCGTAVFSTIYNTYESALSEGIKEAVKILKNGIGE